MSHEFSSHAHPSSAITQKNYGKVAHWNGKTRCVITET